MLFALMGAGVVMTNSLPAGFGERGLSFAVAFVVMQLGRLARRPSAATEAEAATADVLTDVD